MMTAKPRKTSLENISLLLCDYPILVAFYNVGVIRYNRTGVRAVKSSAEIYGCMLKLSSKPQCGNFTLLFSSTARNCYKVSAACAELLFFRT